MTTPAQRHARFRAQHASQHLPVRRRKPVVMLAPVDPTGATPSMLRDVPDSSCDDCGYLQCCCIKAWPKPDSGPTLLERLRAAAPPPAPAAPAAKCKHCLQLDGHGGGACPYMPAAPAPSGGRAFVVGQRVLLTFAYSAGHVAVGQRGRIVEVITVENPHSMWVRDGAAERTEYKEICLSARDLEPAPSLTPECEREPIAECESDEALLRRTGWTGKAGSSFLDYSLPDGRVAWVSPLGATPSYFRSGADFGNSARSAPTLLQAACAALGIRIEPCSMADGPGFLAIAANHSTVSHSDKERCARAALERWSKQNGGAS